MAKFEFDGIDDLMEDLNTIEIDCPNCDRSFEVNLNDIGSVVTCPHCKAKIELESE